MSSRGREGRRRWMDDGADSSERALTEQPLLGLRNSISTPVLYTPRKQVSSSARERFKKDGTREGR